MTCYNVDMQLSQLLSAWVEPITALPRLVITNLSLHSQHIQPQGLFVALNRGVEYIPDAVANGAAAILTDQLIQVTTEVPVIQIKHLARVYGDIASKFYQHPSEQLTIIGVTGTNGKTSVTYYLAQLISSLLAPCGVIGTLGVGTINNLQHTGLTTPDAITVQQTLQQFVASGVKYVAMEVSSHALAQHRVQGVKFASAIFTNLTHDHLDYHGTMQQYAAEKFKLFTDYHIKHAIINIDDATGQAFNSQLENTITYSCETNSANFYVENICYQPQGITANLITAHDNIKLNLPLLGKFNLSNVLACMATVTSFGVSLEKIVNQLPYLQAVPGRMQCVSAENKPLVIIDYAHTPDALEKALTAIKQHNTSKLWCVFGCGGDRDRTKRPEMAKVTEALAQYVIVTSDNPRNEQPQTIIDNICTGFSNIKPIVIIDRAQAINYAINHAALDEVVLIAGKGHEDYQIIGNDKLYFSDLEQVRLAFDEYF